MDAISLADAALARALHFSIMSDRSSAATHRHYSPLLYADDRLASYAPVTCSDSSVLLAADDHSPRRSSSTGGGAGSRLAPAGARAGKKRRSRASKRAPTTYISTDPSNFRLMVQQITGVQAEPAAVRSTAAFDASVLLLPADDTNPLLTAPPGDHHQQQPCFPTLDSWNVVSMYGRNDDLL